MWVDSKTNVQLKTVTKWVCEDTGALLLPSQMKLAFTYGGEKVQGWMTMITRIDVCDRLYLRRRTLI